MIKSSRKRINTLNKHTKELALLLLPKADEWLKENGWKEYTFEITEGRRDIYKQAGYYSQGREYMMYSGWKVRDFKKIITWTMNSNHLEGNAFDCALHSKKIYYWPNPEEFKNLKMWLGIAEIAKHLGLYPGALWENNKPDYPHFSSLPG